MYREWELDPNTINHATAGNTFMIGAGGLVAVLVLRLFWSPTCLALLPNHLRCNRNLVHSCPVI